MNKSIDASPFLKISASKAQEEVFLDGNLAPDDSDKKIMSTLKFSALTHVVSLVLILSIGYVVQKFFKENPKKFEVVLLDPSTSKSFQDLKLPPATVKMIENRRPQKSIVRAPIKPTPIKPRQRMLAQPSAKRVVPQVEIGAMRALDQLGGLGSETSSKTKGSGSSASGRGAFGSKVGLGGGLGSSTGGIKNGLSGKGLVSGLSGEGSKAIGANGMGSAQYAGGNRGFGGKASSAALGALIVPDFDDSEIVGGLTREQVNSVVKKNEGQLRFCYEKALQSQPNLRGRMTSKWAIGPSGKVQFFKVTSSSLTSKEVETCVSNAIRAWQFPKPVGGVTVEVNYPFDFGRQQWMAKEG
jgi:hypothetical protein